MKRIDEIEIMASLMRKRALKMAYDCGSNGSHLGGGLSTIEILATLYGGVLNYNVKEPLLPTRDRLVVSKGHCVLAQYTALYHVGFLTEEDLSLFEKNDSPYHGHSCRNLSKGFEFSNGSLSMGISFAVGVALANKKNKLNNKVYTIVGDGECDEGLVWEAAMSASKFNLSNLMVIIDCNGLQYDGPTFQTKNSYTLADRFKSFGFKVLEVDGHNCTELLEAFNSFDADMPTAVIAHTTKGKGASFMENKKEWHHSILTMEQYEQALKEQI